MVISGYGAQPDYRIDLLVRGNLVLASLDGTTLASSRRTILLDEQGHRLVYYFPPDDVRFDRLTLVAGKTSFCPFKGEAQYYAAIGAAPASAVAWRYPGPFAQVAAITGYVAFYQHLIFLTVQD